MLMTSSNNKTIQITPNQDLFKKSQMDISPAKLIQEDLEKLEKQLYTIDDKILDDKVDTKKIQDELLEAKKLKMKTLIRLNAIYYETNGITKKKYEEYKEKVEHITTLLSTFEEYNTSNTQKEIQRGIDILTMVTLIVLPLTLITSFFGMNFNSLGNVTSKYGLFSKRNAHWYVLGFILLYIISIIIGFQYFNPNPKDIRIKK
jgi:magnesium transporter